MVASMKSFWAQLYIFPKKIFKKIESICRSFLWKGNGGGISRGYVAWSSIINSVACGGLGIRDFIVWNQATIIK